MPSAPEAGVKSVVQVPPERVHAGAKDPDALVQVTVPVGVAAVGESVSVTVAVHTVGELTTRLVGEQEAAIDVERVVAVTSRVEADAVWSVSPP